MEATVLILSRRPGETIIKLPTDEKITVAVVGINDNQVRIVVAATADVTIPRGELIQPELELQS